MSGPGVSSSWGYEDALGWLYSTQRFGIKLGLENISRLMQELGNPHLVCPCFHVAGTNGKGSVCAMIAEALRVGGLRVGLYTSPHLVDFAERIRIDGEKVSKGRVAEGLRRLRKLTEGWAVSPTFFEYTTALAFEVFREEGCEVLVVETGMGGRLDATNVVEPEVAVLTPVGIDHARWLGASEVEIAGEKAGIMKAGRRAVSAPQREDVGRVFKRVAEERGVDLVFVDKPWEGELALYGSHQRWNASLAKAALEVAGYEVGGFEDAMRRVRWPGRFQELGGGWVLDGAHNPHALAALVDAWRERFGELRVPVVFGCLADKDSEGMLEVLRPVVSELHLVPVCSERACEPGGLRVPVGIVARRWDDLGKALEEVGRGGSRVLVTGSLFLVGEVLERLAGLGSDVMDRSGEWNSR